MEQKHVVSDDEQDALRGFVVAVNAVYTALVCEPTPAIVSDVYRVGGLLELEQTAPKEAGKILTQQYYDRFFVPTAPTYIPLIENSIREASVSYGRLRFGATSGRWSQLVAGSYQALHFDWKALPGDEVATRCLRPDSLACEMAFMSALAGRAIGRSTLSLAARATAARLACQFAREHPLCWLNTAAQEMERSSIDFYSYVVRIAAHTTAGIASLYQE